LQLQTKLQDSKMVHAKEIWDAGKYNKANGQQYRDAEETIQHILDDNLGEVDIIVDIGCGSGNVTKMVSTRVPHKRMLAVDFDAQMVEYADKNYNDGTIEYFVQDMNVPWEKLDERLKSLEGKVDIVWSNRVLHWVKYKQQAVNIISRLMKKDGGRCYINTTLIRDISEFVAPEEKAEMEKVLDNPHNDKQMENWRKYFGNCGLSKVVYKELQKNWTYDTDEEFDTIEISASKILLDKLLMRDDIPETERESIVKKYSPILMNSFCSKYGENYLDPNFKFDGKTVYYEQYRILGVK